MTSFWRAVMLPSNWPRISAMSISAEPLNEPRSEIWMTRESIVASTEPSTTSVSQSVISTPLSLMFGPTISLLPTSLVLEGTDWADWAAFEMFMGLLAEWLTGEGVGLDVKDDGVLPVLLMGGFGVLAV